MCAHVWLRKTIEQTEWKWNLWILLCREYISVANKSQNLKVVDFISRIAINAISFLRWTRINLEIFIMDLTRKRERQKFLNSIQVYLCSSSFLQYSLLLCMVSFILFFLPLENHTFIHYATCLLTNFCTLSKRKHWKFCINLSSHIVQIDFNWKLWMNVEYGFFGFQMGKRHTFIELKHHSDGRNYKFNIIST